MQEGRPVNDRGIEDEATSKDEYEITGVWQQRVYPGAGGSEEGNQALALFVSAPTIHGVDNGRINLTQLNLRMWHSTSMERPSQPTRSSNRCPRAWNCD